ncbi:MAG: hypothetical protein NC483_06045 [Ruminococcus sp.]|nr:hypothetical protein [Ruminococcus sp.]
MKFERNRNSKRYFLCGLISVVVLTITVTFITSKANYRMTASIPLTEGKVVASPYDINVMAMYINDGDGNYIEDKTNIIPSGDYTINEEKSYCYKTNKDTKDNNAKVYTDELGNHVIKGTSKGSKCIIYFEKNSDTGKTMSELLNTHYKYKSTRTSENKDFNVPYEETTYGIIFEALDDNGTTYYFAGNPLDNWVEFGEYYWRIIRVNGDGSIRLIYQGRTQDEKGNKLEPQTTGNETQIGKSQFNSARSDNMYVGYFYTSGIQRGLGTASIVYTTLNNWFASSNIKQESAYFDKIDQNAGFCGDRSAGTNSGSVGTGTTTTYYNTYYRLRPDRTSIPTSTSTAVTPVLTCADSSDLYTYKNANQGNKVLDNPVGMLTIDEVAYAGKVFATSSKSNYLDTDNDYWTISPSYYNAYGADIFCMRSNNVLDDNYANQNFGIRPVINLKSSTTFTGSGTQSNPYKVVI